MTTARPSPSPARRQAPRRRSAPAVAAAVEHATTERELMDAVVELARLAGYMAYHTHDSRRSQPGFPDLVLAHCDPRRPRVLWVELKSARGRLSPAQAQWRDVLTSAGCEWHCWRPQDWLDGAVERTLLLTAPLQRENQFGQRSPVSYDQTTPRPRAQCSPAATEPTPAPTHGRTTRQPT